jgi:hypothetical protein
MPRDAMIWTISDFFPGYVFAPYSNLLSEGTCQPTAIHRYITVFLMI